MDNDYAGKLGHKDRKNLKSKNNNKNFPKKGNSSKQNNKDKFNRNKYNNNNKFCEIYEKRGHSTKECRYNPRNPKGLYNKYYIQDEQKYRNNYHPHYNGQNGKAVRYINLNNEYNENVSYDDIRPMFYKYYDPKSKGKYVDDDDSDEYQESEKSNCFINYDKEDVKNEVLIKNNITTRVENKLNLVKEIFINSINKKEINTNNTNEIFNINYNKTETSEWLYDSGAGEYITYDLSLLKNFKKEKIKLRCTNNTYCYFEGYGKFEFTINNHHFKFNKVLYSGEVAKNIISGVEWAKQG